MCRVYKGVLPVLGALLLGLACGRMEVQRTVEWSGGDQVVFQDEAGGVHVAAGDGQALSQVFAPGNAPAVVGSPIPHPQDKRILFATMDFQEGLSGPSEPGGPITATPLVKNGGFIYRCWLKESADSTVEPVLLFEAKAHQIDYVAGNLAVRWHPHGESVYFVDNERGWEQSLYRFDLKTKAKQRVFPHSGNDLAFELSRDGKYVACALLKVADPKQTGLWIASTANIDEWRYLPESARLAGIPGESPLERLRQTLPVWSPQGSQFAFVARMPRWAEGGDTTPKPSTADACTLYLASFGGETKSALVDIRPLRDLAWIDDDKIAFLEPTDEGGRVRMWSQNTGELTSLSGDDMVQRLGGPDPVGRQIVYVASSWSAEQLQNFAPNGNRYLLLNPLANQKLVVAPIDQPEARRALVTGLEIGQPRWSPGGDRLAAWLTFQPAYRPQNLQLASIFLKHSGYPMIGADPAAIIETDSGAIHWMPTTALEETYIGHYFLAQKRYEEAWAWYTKAEKRGLHLASPTTARAFLLRWLRVGDPRLYQALCLEKLGRGEEARVYREEFDATFWVAENSNAKSAERSTIQQEAAELTAIYPRDVWRELADAETFAAVGAIDEGVAYFASRLETELSPEGRESCQSLLEELRTLR